PELERQVRIQGIATRVSTETSDIYFQSRPRESQLGAWASPQSTTIESRALLEQRFREAEKKFEGRSILDRPDHWGGFQVDADVIEVWQGGAGRLHDRILYTKAGDNTWDIQRLAP